MAVINIHVNWLLKVLLLVTNPQITATYLTSFQLYSLLCLSRFTVFKRLTSICLLSCCTWRQFVQSDVLYLNKQSKENRDISDLFSLILNYRAKELLLKNTLIRFWLLMRSVFLINRKRVTAWIKMVWTLCRFYRKCILVGDSKCKNKSLKNFWKVSPRSITEKCLVKV